MSHARGGSSPPFGTTTIQGLQPIGRNPFLFDPPRDLHECYESSSSSTGMRQSITSLTTASGAFSVNVAFRASQSMVLS